MGKKKKGYKVGQFRSLADQWVFYSSIDTDNTSETAKNMVKNLRSSLSAWAGVGEAAEKDGYGRIRYLRIQADLRAMADNERAKEIAWLNFAFGERLGDMLYGYSDNKNFDKWLTETVNIIMSSKKIFNANLSHLFDTKGTKPMYVWFAERYEKTLKLLIPELEAQLRALMQSPYINSPDTQEKRLNIITAFLNKCTTIALTEALGQDVAYKGKTIAGAKTTAGLKVDNPFAEIGKALYTLSAPRNPLLNRFSEIYGLQKISEEFAKDTANFTNVSVSDQAKNIADMARTTLRSATNNNFSKAINAGLLFEAMEKFILDVMKEEEKSTYFGGEGIKFKQIVKSKSFNVGKVNARDDLVEVYGNDAIQKVNQFYKENKLHSGKMESIEDMRKLQQQLQNVEEGYIVHRSLKLYTLNENFHGYNTLDGISSSELMTVLNGLSNVPISTGRVNKIISATQQLGKGAIGSSMGSQIKDSISAELATYFAQIFYDDVDTIGENLTKQGSGSGVKHIHMIDVQGLNIPLSVFLYKLSNAFQPDSAMSPKDIVNVSIHAPDILWPPETDHAGRRFEGMPAWEEQRQSALDNTTYTIRFLKEIRAFVADVLNRTVR